MDELSLEDSGLPDTQGADPSSSISGDSNNDANIWGHLFSVQDGFASIDLIKDKYTFGRFSVCDVVYQERDGLQPGIEPSLLGTLSKVHFSITRDETSKIVHLLDNSSNGTFINEILVGQNKTAVLEPNDLIALALPTKKIYLFVSNGPVPQATSFPSVITERYHVSRKLGSGAYGQVCLVFDKATKARYALKTVSKLKAEIEFPGLVNEATLLQELNHPCIIKVIAAIDSIVALHIVLELMEGGDLLARTLEVVRFQEAEAKFINYQIALAIKYLHDRNISHRDLKMDNILLNAKKEYPCIKLADFGLSRKFGKSLMTTFCGTPLYVAPEVLISQGKKIYTKEVDIWSLGVIAYISLSGEHPFQKTEKMPLNELIIRGCYFFSKPVWEDVSAQAIEIIKMMMNIKPDERFNITQVLGHQWLTVIGIDIPNKKIFELKFQSMLVPREDLQEDDPMRKKAHAALRIPFKRPPNSNENVVPNRRKKQAEAKC